MIKFSIITVVYNGQNCIKKTIDSVFNQSYNNYEYIIIDGNSKDDTLKICEEHKEKITKIVSEPDKGLYDAMNKGIENASGDYIIFMNCGDTFYDEFVLEKVAQAIEMNNRPDFVYGDAIEVSEDETQKFLKKARSHKFIWYGMFTHHQAMIYKLKIVKDNKLLYNLKYRIGADYAFTAEYLKYCRKILKLNLPICLFKQGGSSFVSYKEGIKDQWFIRKNILKINWLGRLAIFLIHFLIIIIRRKFPCIYNFLRFN